MTQNLHAQHRPYTLARSRAEAMAETAGSPIQVECWNEGEGDCPCGADLVWLELEDGRHIGYVDHHDGCTA